MAENPYKRCTLCPISCGTDRTVGNTGRCGSGDKMKIARIAPHMWEEPCISGQKGSGTVFFTGCSLHCVYCQNSKISSRNTSLGTEYTEKQLAEAMLCLQERGVHNINLVTASHFLPSVIKTLKIAKKQGLKIPVVYNCSGYETPQAVSSLSGLIDIFMPDIKYFSSRLSLLYSGVQDYPEIAFNAIKLMRSISGSPVFENGLMLSGTLVRHLILPGSDADSRKIITRLFSEYGKDDIALSLMSQYTPMPNVKFPELTERLPKNAYLRTVAHAQKLGFSYLYTQNGDSAKESFIPEFS